VADRAPRPLDDIDRQILDLLREDARRTVKDIADRVKLSAAPVKRRIERMEEEGVILGYTVRLGQVGPALEAFTELRYSGSMDQDELFDMFRKIPEIHGAFTMAGDVDALLHVRAEDIHHLQQIISKLRASGNPVASKTMIVLRKEIAQRLHEREPSQSSESE